MKNDTSLRFAIDFRQPKLERTLNCTLNEFCRSKRLFPNVSLVSGADASPTIVSGKYFGEIETLFMETIRKVDSMQKRTQAGLSLCVTKGIITIPHRNELLRRSFRKEHEVWLVLCASKIGICKAGVITHDEAREHIESYIRAALERPITTYGYDSRSPLRHVGSLAVKTVIDSDGLPVQLLHTTHPVA